MKRSATLEAARLLRSIATRGTRTVALAILGASKGKVLGALDTAKDGVFGAGGMVVDAGTMAGVGGGLRTAGGAVIDAGESVVRGAGKGIKSAGGAVGDAGESIVRKVRRPGRRRGPDPDEIEDGS